MNTLTGAARLLASVVMMMVAAVSQARALPIIPTNADRAAFSKGEAMQRAIDMLQDPRVCGIVLLRQRCTADIAAMLSLSPAQSPSAALLAIEHFASTGDSELYDSKWTDANYIAVPGALWNGDPRTAWLETAGIIVEASYSQTPQITQLFSSPQYSALARYASEAEPYGVLIPEALAARAKEPSPLSLTDTEALSNALLPALKALFPATAEPVVTSTSGIRGDMQLGVEVSAANEMFESPTLFLQPQSRAFLHDLCLRISSTQPDADSAAQWRTLGQQFLVAGTPTDWRNAYQIYQGIRSNLASQRVGQSKEAFLLGLFAAQTAYNAAILRDRSAEQDHLHLLSSITDLDAILPGLGAERAAVLAADARNWDAVNTAATRLTLWIMLQ